MTDRSTNRQNNRLTDQQTDMRGHREVTHPKIVVLGKSVEMWNTRALAVCSVPTYRALSVIWVYSEGKILRYWFHRGKLITGYYFILKHCQINVGKIVNKKSKKKEEIEEVVNVRFLNSTGPLDLGEKIVTYHRHFLKFFGIQLGKISNITDLSITSLSPTLKASSPSGQLVSSCA